MLLNDRSHGSIKDTYIEVQRSFIQADVAKQMLLLKRISVPKSQEHVTDTEAALYLEHICTQDNKDKVFHQTQCYSPVTQMIHFS